MTNLADYNQNYISSAVGNAGNYRVNTRTGRLDFEKSVANFNGSLLSEEIYFVYNPFHETHGCALLRYVSLGTTVKG